MLDFGIFDHFERPRDVPLDRAFEERLQLLNRADELGYYAYHLAEHHQSPLCMAPSQNVFLAAVARGTRRIKLGTLVHLLPMYHPLRFIEEHVPAPLIGSSRHIVVADTDAEAERIARAAWPVFQDNFSKRGMVGPGTVEARDFNRARFAESVLVGSPETIGEYVQRYAEESGANYFVGAFQWGNITHEQAVHSLELFATQVMPRFATGVYATVEKTR